MQHSLKRRAILKLLSEENNPCDETAIKYIHAGNGQRLWLNINLPGGVAS